MKKILFLTFVLFVTIMSQAQGESRTNKMEVVFKTQPEIECERCVARVKDALTVEKGVLAVNPDLKTKLITVQFDNSKTSNQRLIDALSKAGFKATVVDPSEKKVSKKDDKQPATTR